MALTPHQALSIVLVIYYIPSLVPTSFLLHQHSVGRAWGWLYLFIFVVFRITGAGLQFASDSSESNGLRQAASTLASIGVMTLLLAMLEVIENVYVTIANKYLIGGRRKLTDPENQLSPPTLSILASGPSSTFRNMPLSSSASSTRSPAATALVMPPR